MLSGICGVHEASFEQVLKFIDPLNGTRYSQPKFSEFRHQSKAKKGALLFDPNHAHDKEWGILPLKKDIYEHNLCIY